MDLGRLTYNNLMDEYTWNGKTQAKQNNDEKNYLALATQMMIQVNSVSKNRNPGGQRGRGKQQNDDRTYLPWRFKNSENKATKEVRGSTMNWCTIDCYEKLMWC